MVGDGTHDREVGSIVIILVNCGNIIKVNATSCTALDWVSLAMLPLDACCTALDWVSLAMLPLDACCTALDWVSLAMLPLDACCTALDWVSLVILPLEDCCSARLGLLFHFL